MNTHTQGLCGDAAEVDRSGGLGGRWCWPCEATAVLGFLPEWQGGPWGIVFGILNLFIFIEVKFNNIKLILLK